MSLMTMADFGHKRLWIVVEFMIIKALTRDKMTENANQDRKSERIPASTLRFQRTHKWDTQAVDSRKVVQT